MTDAPNRPPLSDGTQAIREAVDAVFARSPVPPTTDEIAAAVLRALAEHCEAMQIRMAPGCFDFDEAVRCSDMLAIAAELEGQHA